MELMLVVGYSNPVGSRRKLAPDKHKRLGSSQVSMQSHRTLEFFATLANMSIPFKCMIVFLVLVQVQTTKGLVFSPMEVNTVDINNNMAPTGRDPIAQNGTFKKEISDLFKDLSNLSDNVSKETDQGNKTLSTLRNNSSVLDQALANASSFGVTTNSQAEGDDNSLIISVITANILIFVIGFCGNSLVILVILRFTRIETVTDIYILNLAFADLMFLFGLIFLIITMFIDHWIFGTLMCKLYMASTSLNQFASSLLLVVMSFDRFLAVCHPIYAQRFRRLRRAKIICFCIWIMCLILMTPIFAFAKTNKELTCAIFWPEYKSFNCEIAFTLYSFAIGFAVPLSLIAAFYTCVIRKLRVAASGPISLGSTRRSRSRETTNRRIEHLVIGIICTYTICWLPYWITQLCVSFTTTLDRSPIEGFYPFVLIATCLSYTNSALNPILYAFLSDNFKRRCADVFRSIYSIKWCRTPQCQEAHSTVATAVCDQSELHINEINNKNNSNNNNNNISNNNIIISNNSKVNNFQRPESRQTVVMNESIRLVASPNRFEGTDQLTSAAPDGLIAGKKIHACDKVDANELDCLEDDGQRLDQMIDNKLNEYQRIGSQKRQPCSDCCCPDQRNSEISNHCTCINSLKDDLGSDDKFYELDTVNNSSPNDNQNRRRSVAFSIGTIVVQAPNNNGQIVKGSHTILQVTDKKLQHRQEAV